MLRAAGSCLYMTGAFVFTSFPDFVFVAIPFSSEQRPETIAALVDVNLKRISPRHSGGIALSRKISDSDALGGVLSTL